MNKHSENTIFVHGQMTGELIHITGFSREKPSKFERANIVAARHDFMQEASGAVFDRLTEHLPL